MTYAGASARQPKPGDVPERLLVAIETFMEEMKKGGGKNT